MPCGIYLGQVVSGRVAHGGELAGHIPAACPIVNHFIHCSVHPGIAAPINGLPGSGIQPYEVTGILADGAEISTQVKHIAAYSRTQHSIISNELETVVSQHGGALRLRRMAAENRKQQQ